MISNELNAYKALDVAPAQSVRPQTPNVIGSLMNSATKILTHKMFDFLDMFDSGSSVFTRGDFDPYFNSD